MQRDDMSNKLVVDLGTITIASTGDDDGSVDLDTKGARAVSFILIPSAALTTQETYFQLLESADDADADPYAEVAADKYLPTELAVTDDSESGVLLVEATSPYQQIAGVFSTKRWLRPRFHTDVSQASIDVQVIAVMEMETGSQTATWNPNVDSVDGEP
jgi:hypothetical protein